MGVYAAIIHGGRIQLVMVRKHTPDERTSKSDHLGLNGHKSATNLHAPHLIPFIKSLMCPPDKILIVEDNTPSHKGAENRKLRQDYGYTTLPWPPNSPDPNPIENVWALLKANPQRAMV